MYRKVSLSSFHNGKVEYCAIFGSGDIEENGSVIFFYSDFISQYLEGKNRTMVILQAGHMTSN